MNKLLVTSNIPESFGEKEDIIFIDDVCFFYLDKKHYLKRNYKKLEDLFLKFENKNYEYYYHLKELHQNLINSLTKSLNEFHKVNYTNRFWQIILDPWLIDYVTCLYLKFKKIDKLLKYEKNLNYYFFKKLSNYPKSYDYFEFENQLRGDLFHQHLYQRIILQEYKNNFLIFYKDNFNTLDLFVEEIAYINNKVKIFNPLNLKSLNKNKIPFFQKFLKSILIFYDTILGKIIKNYNVVFIDIKMPHISYLKLCFSLKQFPRFFIKEFNESNIQRASYNHKIREFLLVDIKPKNKLENYLKNNIKCDLPISLIEDFNKFIKISKNIKINTKKILFDNVIFGNQLVKYWIAIKSADKKIKLISAQHGGSLKLPEENFDFELNISDIRFTWHKSMHSREIQMPPLKLAGSVNLKKKINGYCLLVPYSGDFHQTRIDFCPNDIRCLEHVDQYKKMYENLNSSIQNFFMIKPDISKGCNEEFFMKKIFKNNQFIKNKNLLDSFKLSKVIICTYPETTFIEALATDIPTILIYPKNLWIIHEMFRPLVSLLKDLNIIFYDPIKAAKHLNDIWENPYLWWHSEKIRTNLNKIHEYVGNPSNKNWLKVWKENLDKI